MDPVDFNYAHSINVFGSSSKTGEVLEARDFVLSNTKAPIAEFNQSMLKTPRYKLARTLDRVQAYYAQAKVPFRVSLPIDDAAVTSELLSRGFSRQPDLPCMVFEGARCDAPSVPGLEIGTVRDSEGLADFQRIAFGSFGYPVEIAPIALTPELAAMPHVTLFVGYMNGAAVCCSAIITTGEVAGVYWVGTVAGQRKLGLGAAITAHAVNEGYARGCKHACLQASPLGRPVYQRIGFVQARAYPCFNHAAL